MAYEIERKYLIKKIPDNLDSFEKKIIEQGYLNQKPVVRIRRSNDDYYLTYKGSGLLKREEANLMLTKDAYEHLLPKCDGHIIKKVRHLIPYNDELTIELDVFSYPEGLIMAEVEFPSKEAANSFEAPEWFGKEVTLDPAYHNVNMIR